MQDFFHQSVWDFTIQVRGKPTGSWSNIWEDPSKELANNTCISLNIVNYYIDVGQQGSTSGVKLAKYPW